MLMQLLLQSFRMTWRDWRAGELRFLLIALMVAVGALSSVGFFVDRVSNGLLVLYAALQSSQQERLREAAILRASGASTKQLSKAQWIEYGLLGGLAGMLAASGAAIIGWVLARWIFEFAFQPNPLLWIVGVLAGAGCAWIGSWLGLHHILKQPHY